MLTEYADMCVTTSELSIILREVVKNHFLKGRSIKYTNCDFDSRTNSFWRIEFRHWMGGKTTFTNTNVPIKQRRDLFESIMKWLKGVRKHKENWNEVENWRKKAKNPYGSSGKLRNAGVKHIKKLEKAIAKNKKHKKGCTCRKCMEDKYGEIF